MFDINDQSRAAAPAPGTDLAKAHPAADLSTPAPGWTCGECDKRNSIHDAFCKHCEAGQ